jgi:hypothetical protein
MNPNQTVRLRNTGDKPFRDMFEGNEFTCPPGQEVFVPYGAACVWFGDPATPTLNEQRSSAYSKLRARYGILATDPQDKADDSLPKVEVYTLSTNSDGLPERIYTVLDDPKGIRGSSAPDAVNPGDEAEMLRAQILEMQRGQQAILAVLQQINPQAAADLSSLNIAPPAPVLVAGPDADPATTFSGDTPDPAAPAAGPIPTPDESRVFSAPAPVDGPR